MNIVILGSPESRYCRDLQRAAQQRGHRCDVTALATLTSELTNTQESFQGVDVEPLLPLERYDVAIIRTMPPGSLEQVVFRMDLLWSLSQTGVRVVNSPKSIECAVDKYLSLTRCRRAGLLIPETFCCESAQQALEQFEAWGRSALVKPIFGAEGRGIVHVTDPETARRVFRAIEQIGAVLYLQRPIANDGSDLRVLMLDGQPLGAIRRTASQDFRTNCAQSGVPSAHQLTQSECDMATRACQAIGVEFAGVDLMYDQRDGQLCLLEVNGCPGWSAFERITKIDVASRFIDWLDAGMSSS